MLALIQVFTFMINQEIIKQRKLADMHEYMGNYEAAHVHVVNLIMLDKVKDLFNSAVEKVNQS